MGLLDGLGHAGEMVEYPELIPWGVRPSARRQLRVPMGEISLQCLDEDPADVEVMMIIFYCFET
jgi:hypothetical protein